MYCINEAGEVVNKPTTPTATGKSVQQQSTHQTTALHKDNTTIKQTGAFAKQVVEKMIRENIPATPENFAIYFEKLLDEKPLKQRKMIQKVLEAESVEENVYVAHLENNIKESFRQIKVILENVSAMYAKINKLKLLTHNKIEELSAGSGQIALVAYEEQLEEIIGTLSTQQKTIKEKYTDIAEKIKLFHANTIFDPKYDVYNKNYLLKTIEAEKKNIFHFGYESSLIAFKIKEQTFAGVKSQKDRELVIKNIATMILKRSRRSDIVAHLGGNVFVIVLKHTSLQQAERVIESLDNLIANTNYIIDSHQIDIELDYGLTKIVHNKTRDQILSELISQLM